MAITLHEAFVPSALQMLGSVAKLIDKAEAHCNEKGRVPGALITASLAPDMLDFAYQVKSCAVHSVGAIEGVRSGNFSPDMTTPPDSFEGLRALVADAIAKLETTSVEQMDAIEDKRMTFTIGDKLRWDFVGKDFLLSFSQPNLYFHVTTAYDILRKEGVAIGKVDYLGAMRMAS